MAQDIRTTNSHGINSFFAKEQVYGKMTILSDSKQRKGIKTGAKCQIYVLFSEKSANEKLEHLKNCKLSSIQATFGFDLRCKDMKFS